MKITCIFTLLFIGCCFSQALAVDETTGEPGRFQPVGKNIIYDSQTGLMWAASDNGEDIDWYDAEAYCKDFAVGGYNDWRLPDIKELATLYTSEKKNKDGFYIIDLVRISDCCMWSSDTNMGGSSVFSYKTGNQPVGSLADKYQLRALPVRDHKKPELQENKVINTVKGSD